MFVYAYVYTSMCARMSRCVCVCACLQTYIYVLVDVEVDCAICNSFVLLAFLHDCFEGFFLCGQDLFAQVMHVTTEFAAHLIIETYNGDDLCTGFRR